MTPARPVKSRFMAYDKTVSLGHLLTAGTILVSVAVAYGSAIGRIETSEKLQAQQRQEFTNAIGDIREALKEQRLEQKDLARAVSAITTDTALIRGRLASDGTTSNRK